MSVHLTFGNPSGAVTNSNVRNNYLLVRDQYAMSYNDNTRIANWVGWQLNDSWRGSAPRQNDFRPDNQLPASFSPVSQNDYRGSGFDRGHITPSADRTATVADNSSTFFMSNMMPQAPNNNRGVWGDFEQFLRSEMDGKDIYIYAGGRGQGGTGSNGFDTFIGPNNDILVPSSTWKTALIVDAGESPSQVGLDDTIISIDIPNSQSVSGTDWEDWVVSVNDIEFATGYDFFSALPNSIEASLEAEVNTTVGGSGGGSGFGSDTNIFINEIHYDNSGSDTGEGIEIAGPASTNLNGWSLEFYNGNGGGLYRTVNLSGTLSNQDSGFGTDFFGVSGIQNGAPDGVALIDNNDNVVQFLSYEGTLTAANGTAAGLTSTNIGVSETSSTPVGHSLQLVGTGDSYNDFTWANASFNSYDSVNSGQNFV